MQEQKQITNAASYIELLPTFHAYTCIPHTKNIDAALEIHDPFSLFYFYYVITFNQMFPSASLFWLQGIIGFSNESICNAVLVDR